jgi:O-antigen ligase
LFFILQSEKKYQKVFFGLCALVQLLAIYQSGTRGAVVGLILGGFISSVLYLFFTKNKKLKFYGSIVVGVIVLVSGLLYLNSDKLPTGSTLKRVFQLNDTNTQARLVQWKTALSGFKDRPFLGTGPENYYIVSNKYFNPEIYNYDRSWFDKPHNFLLEILITTGVLGFVFYVSIIFFSFYAVYLGFKNGFLSLAEGTLLFAGMLSYQIQNLFVFDSVPSSLMFYIYVAFFGYLFFCDA